MDHINDNNYTQWVERFLDAETTLDQERELYAYFARPDLPEHARRYRAMFGWYEGLESSDRDSDTPATSPVRLLPLRLWQWAGIAAVILLLFAAGFMLRPSVADHGYVTEDGTIYSGYMIRDGKKITDMALISAEMDRINSEIDSHLVDIDSYMDDYTSQLHDEIMSSYDMDNPDVRDIVETAFTF
ncbi:MAG: hypothetical protein K2G27_10170 [Duncaniella sp.]|nr:hypothetical protein [Duncaniella sp.]